MWITLLIFLLVAAGLVVGILIARSGWRGIQVDEHPCCGRCAFDLHGCPPDARCPECGSGPDVPRSIGNRVRSPRRIAVGAALVVLTTMILAAGAMQVASPDKFRSMAPLWAVKAEAHGGSLAAINELARRIQVGRVDKEDLLSLTDDALARRQSDWVALRATWGGVVDAAIASGGLDKARLNRCYSEAVAVNWNGSSERFSTGAVQFLFIFGATVGPRSGIGYTADITAASMDGQPLRIGPKDASVFYPHVPNPSAPDTFIGLEVPPRIAGKTLVVTWHVRIFDQTTGAALAPDWNHTESIAIPNSGDGFIYGTRSRTPPEREP